MKTFVIEIYIYLGEAKNPPRQPERFGGFGRIAVMNFQGLDNHFAFDGVEASFEIALHSTSAKIGICRDGGRL